MTPDEIIDIYIMISLSLNIITVIWLGCMGFVLHRIEKKIGG